MKINSVRNSSAFGNRKAFLLDGGGHGSSMEHFAKAVFKNTGVDVDFRSITTIGKYDAKVFGDLSRNLQELNKEANKGDTVIIPALALGSFGLLEDALKSVLNKVENLTTKNLIFYKNTLLELLKKMASDEVQYSNELNKFDYQKQEFQFLPKVIQEINNLIKKGVDVYLPSGHPIDYPIRGTLEAREQLPDLYKYIATGVDTDNNVHNVCESLKDSKAYNVNLLALSDAHVVNVTKMNGEPHIYGAFDSLVNDKARGVFNFYPIRNWFGSVINFSFVDRKTPQFSAFEYNGLKSISNILQFVGFNINKKIANKKEHKILREFISKNKDVSQLPDKLYKISEIYDEEYIRNKKLDYLGQYMNKTGDLIFDVNGNGEILFQKLNCEGSDRPSVNAMWGSCFASINAAKRDMCN